MKRLHRLISMALLLIVSMASIAAGQQNFIGVARDTDSEVQYIEHHQYLDSGEHRINYYSPELTLLVQKKAQLSRAATPSECCTIRSFKRHRNHNAVTNEHTVCETGTRSRNQ